MSQPGSTLDTRPSLLLRLRDPQDAEAWATFVEIYGPLVYRYARLRGLQDADAADVMQEVMAEVARGMPTFEYRPERGRFRDWLGTLTRRRLWHFFQKKAHNPAVPVAAAAEEVLAALAAPAPDPEWADVFAAHVLQVALERVRGSFAPCTWRAFEDVWLKDRAPAETARELGVSTSAVYLAKWRVLKRLREEVRMLAEDAPLYGGE